MKLLVPGEEWLGVECAWPAAMKTAPVRSIGPGRKQRGTGERGTVRRSLRRIRLLAQSCLAGLGLGLSQLMR